MKITHSRTGKEVELPKYFKSGRASFMLTDNDKFVKVMEDSWEFGFNYIRCEHVQFLQYEDIETVDHISETEFKNSFIRVSLEIEKLMN